MTETEERDLSVSNARAAYQRGEITLAEFMQLLRIWATVSEAE